MASTRDGQDARTPHQPRGRRHRRVTRRGDAGGAQPRGTASLGVSTIRLLPERETPDRQLVERLVEAADCAMYEAKRAGGKQVRHADIPVPPGR
ncbi:hypothetical protein [Mycobacterium terramassiliense]|uniref:hypothetical protein n=1 Tax=Mycobacterium terramassiliense TaxID=1841859 RepID=UPI0012FFB688|nr:hypothetical protein [Mycobacterium terramassiliense]